MKMKNKLIYVSIATVAILSACQDFNEKNFPGYDQMGLPTNVVSYTYEITSADYTTIANAVKKPINDSITAKKLELKNAKTSADSAVIQASLNAMNTRLSSYPVYTSVTKLEQNKFFNNVLKAKDYLPILFALKYPYADANSNIKVTYDLADAGDTLLIFAENKVTISDAEYGVMGKGSNQPGKSNYFLPTMPINNYLNTYLKSKFPYALANETRLIKYKLYTPTALLNQYRVLTFNGTDWKNTTDLYSFKKGKWLDVLILKGLTESMGDFTGVNVLGAQVWAWNSYKYMLMTGYVAGSYYDNEDWLISPAMNLTERVNPWLNFTHVGRYFGDIGTSKDKMKKAITLWVSTTSDGVTFNPNDWTQLTFPEAGYPSGANWTFIPSTPISLAAYAGKNNVRIAFKYLSTGADNAAGSWEVKNVYVTEE
ncbi:MAG: choice-of-anchor J domain-containing protein [Bacteroidales bacterium]